VVSHWTIDPAIYRLAVDDLAALRGGLPATNAARIEALVAGGGGDEAGTAATLLNAGAAIYVAGLAASYAEGLGRARHVLGSGAARAVLEQWRTASVSTSG
jgi:anthranilate phosphoribosyltransferase